MTAGERGFLLLSSHLGDPHRKPLTPAQLRELSRRVRQAQPVHGERQLEPRDLTALGYGADMARRIVGLLEQEALLDAYLRRCEKAGCGVLTRVSEGYPQALRRTLGPDAPGGLWYKGDISILSEPAVAVVGSRDILPENKEFARQAGIQAARQGFTLVSGNARGADRIAQEACLEAGGRVVSVLADALCDHAEKDNVLYLSEDGFDIPFSTPRALSRNRVIHALPRLVLVAQCAAGTGGTWDGTTRNLRSGWSPVCCMDDRSRGTEMLAEMGAQLISASQLKDLSALAEPEPTFFDNI